ncbi:MAG: 50S ribosomal protein L18 [bacterium]
MDIKQKNNRRLARKKRVKMNMTVSDKPRLSVFRSNKFIYAQVHDDAKGATICAVSSVEITGKAKTEQAREAGKKIAELALKKGIKNIVFDRAGYLYHGRVKAFAEGAREAGLLF